MSAGVSALLTSEDGKTWKWICADCGAKGTAEGSEAAKEAHYRHVMETREHSGWR